MPPEVPKNDPKTSAVAPAVVAKAPVASVPDAPASNVNISDAQVERIVKAIIYGSVISGVVFSKPGVTPTAANLKNIQALADAAMELFDE